MTSKTKTRTTTTAAPDATPTPVPVSIDWIDTATARLDANIRTAPDTTTPEWAAWVSQLRAEGVETPVLARRDDDGNVVVWDGQRRLLGARDAGILKVLAIFGTAPGADTERILGQLKTFNRADLPDVDRVVAYEQLAFAGIDVATIAARTGDSTERVTAAIAVAKSETAKQAVAEQVSFERALLVAEFDGDGDAQRRILDCADDDELGWVVEEIRADRALTAHRTQVIAGYEAQGITVFQSRWADSGEFVRVYSLTDADEDATDRPPLDPDQHATCEGRALTVRVWGTGEDDIDVEEVCTRPELHQPRWRTAETSATPVAAEEQTAAQVEAEQEQKREARRRLINCNKQWDAATVVRREFVGTLLGRKALPKGAAPFVAATLTRHHAEVTRDFGDLAAGWLGIDGDDRRERLAKRAEDTPTKAGHVTLGMVLSAREAATSRDSWRYPNGRDTTYLLQLEAWGHHLSPVERIAAGYPEPDTKRDMTPDAA